MTNDYKCLNCDAVLDAATAMCVGDNKIAPGDISLCLYCGHIQAFNDELKLRPLTDAEMYAIAGNPVILALQEERTKALEAFAQMRKQRK